MTEEKKLKLKKISQNELDQICLKHQEWLGPPEKNEGRADLSYKDLSGLDFYSRGSLRGAILKGSDLRNITSFKSDPVIGDFNRIPINFEEADLSGANLSNHTIGKTYISIKGASLHKAILQNVTFEKSTDLTNFDFRNADLSGANLREADLKYTDFRNADLNGADLSTNLTDGMKLGGANLASAKLPEAIEKFEGVKNVEDASKNARTIFLSLLAVSLFCLLTIGGTTDLALITNTTSSVLPIINAPLPLVTFYTVAPLLLLGFFIYFHLYFHHLTQLIAELPAKFPDGTTIDKKIYPWLLNSNVSRYFPRLPDELSIVSTLRHTLGWLLGWGLTPLVLFLFCFRFLPKQDFDVSRFHIVLLAISILISWHFTWANWRAYGSPKRQKHLLRKGTALLLELAVIIIAVSATFLSYHLARHATHGNLNSSDIKTMIILILDDGTYMEKIKIYLNDSLKADLAKKGISTKTDKWNPYNPNHKNDDRCIENSDTSNTGNTINCDDKNLTWVTGANLKGQSLRHADLHKSFLAKANLREANLQGADLISANLQGAYLIEAKLQKAKLWSADLQGANLSYADLQEANLFAADLQGADLRGADLTSVNLQGADLKWAKFTGANNMEDTQIQSAKNWEKAFFDKKMREQLGISDEKTKEELGNYVDSKYVFSSDKEMQEELLRLYKVYKIPVEKKSKK